MQGSDHWIWYHTASSSTAPPAPQSASLPLLLISSPALLFMNGDTWMIMTTAQRARHIHSQKHWTFILDSVVLAFVRCLLFKKRRILKALLHAKPKMPYQQLVTTEWAGLVLLYQVGRYVVAWKDNHYQSSLELKLTVLLMGCPRRDQTALCPRGVGEQHKSPNCERNTDFR